MANPKPLDKSRLDVSQIFLTFTALVGDVDRTAAALDLEPDTVRRLAESEGWTEKIRRISLMSKSERPGDYEKSVNRAMAFVQAQQLRILIGRMLQHLSDLTPKQLAEATGVFDKLGNCRLSAKLWTDLCQASEAASRASFIALGDTVSERLENAQDGDKGLSNSDLHTAIIAALSNPSFKTFSPVENLTKEVEQITPSLGNFGESSVGKGVMPNS